MDKCPKCGHWMLSYEPSREEWVCFCHTCIPCTCNCDHIIPESNEDWNKRLLENNRKGRYSIEPPV